MTLRGRWCSQLISVVILWSGAIEHCGFVSAYLPAPHAKARLNLGGPGAPEQPGWVNVKAQVQHVDPAAEFVGFFTLGERSITIDIRGQDGWHEDPGLKFSEVPLHDHDESIASLLSSSFVCSRPCQMTVDLKGLIPSARYRCKTFHHTNVGAKGGAQFRIQYSGNNEVPLKQGGESWKLWPALQYQETVRADASGHVRITLTKGPISGDSPMNLNGLEIEEVSDKYAQVVANQSYCGGDVEHKDFGELLTLQECTDYVDGDPDCSDHFSWCSSFRGRCRCARLLGNAPDCNLNVSSSSATAESAEEATVRVEIASCSVYRVQEVMSAYLGAQDSAKCDSGSPVAEPSCLTIASTLLGTEPLQTEFRGGSWGSSDKLRPPYGCSVNGDGEVFFNRHRNSMPSGGFRLVCLGLAGSTHGPQGGSGECLPGHYNAERLGECRQCNGGSTRRRRAEACVQCPVGFYDPGGTDDCRRCTGGATRRRRAVECSACAPGHYDSRDADDCAVCQAGSTRRRRAEFCTDCPPGSFLRPDEDDCRVCFDGYTRRRRAHSCTACPENYFPQPGTDDCTICMDPAGCGTTSQAAASDGQLHARSREL